MLQTIGLLSKSIVKVCCLLCVNDGTVPSRRVEFVCDDLAALSSRLLFRGRVEGLHRGVLHSNLR